MTTTTTDTIMFAYLRNAQETSGAWTGDRAEAVEAAVKELDAVRVEDDVLVYRAAETGDYYALTEDEAAEYGAAVLSGLGQAAYSLWCASSGREATTAEVLAVADVKIGDATEDDGDGDSDPPRWNAYVTVPVTINGERYSVSVMVGVREADWGTVEACGDDRGFVDAWWADTSDWANLPSAQMAEAVLTRIVAQSRRIWRAVESARAEEVAR